MTWKRLRVRLTQHPDNETIYYPGGLKFTHEYTHYEKAVGIILSRLTFHFYCLGNIH